jgi:GNAT superfamily N-acetyltransferase
MPNRDLIVERVTATAENLDALARLRIEIFRHWPYLYDGDRAYEEAYLREFVGSDGAVLVMARIGGEPVGMATASPLASQGEVVTAPLVAAGIAVSNSFYFGESVLLPRYRGLGIGHRFFDERESAAREQGATSALFCAVVRQNSHPQRPADARDLAPFWRGRGYAPLAGVQCEISWKDIGEPAETPHPMQFWRKGL